MLNLAVVFLALISEEIQFSKSDNGYITAEEVDAIGDLSWVSETYSPRAPIGRIKFEEHIYQLRRPETLYDTKSYLAGQPNDVRTISTFDKEAMSYIFEHTSEYVQHIRQLEDKIYEQTNVVTLFDKLGVPKEKQGQLYDVCKRVVWIVSYYETETGNSDYLYETGTGIFYTNTRLISAKHVSWKYLCDDGYHTTYPVWKDQYGNIVGHIDCSYYGRFFTKSYRRLILYSHDVRSYDPTKVSLLRLMVNIIIPSKDMYKRPDNKHVHEIKNMERIQYSTKNDILFADTTDTLSQVYKDRVGVQELTFNTKKCSIGAEVLIIGHPSKPLKNAKATGKTLHASDVEKLIYRGVLTITKGKIVKECDGNHIYLDAIAWHSMSGAAIVLKNEPLNVCGILSNTDKVAGKTTTIAVCEATFFDLTVTPHQEL